MTTKQYRVQVTTEWLNVKSDLNKKLVYTMLVQIPCMGGPTCEQVHIKLLLMVQNFISLWSLLKLNLFRPIPEARKANY